MVRMIELACKSEWNIAMEILSVINWYSNEIYNIDIHYPTFLQNFQKKIKKLKEDEFSLSKRLPASINARLLEIE